MSTRLTTAERAEYRRMVEADVRWRQAGRPGEPGLIDSPDYTELVAMLYDGAPRIIHRLLDELDEIDRAAEAMLVQLHTTPTT